MPDINVNKLSEALNTKADIDLNNTGVFSTNGGVVNLVQSTPSDAKEKEVASADFSLKQGGLELMDVIFAPLGIDESKNKRRYLNGQVIIQEQFPAFTAAVKARMTTMANAFTTEVNWQAEKTQSKLGQCGKFVVDDTAGTIRLPCVVNAQGLADLALIGGIKSESLPNIRGTIGTGNVNNANNTGAFGNQTENPDNTVYSTGQYYAVNNFKYNIFDASRVSSAYQDNAPVQQEAVQYPYCIQVATGVEETLPAIREYKTNVPYVLGDSKYFEASPYNASWLESNGQYNASTVYPDMWSQLQVELNSSLNKGDTIEISGKTYVKRGLPVVLSSAAYTDYDFIINTADQTFRLPLISERVLVAKKEPTTEDQSWYNLYSDGWLEQGGRFYNNANVANTISFLKPFKNTDYSLLINHGVSGNYAANISGRHSDEAWGYTTTNFQAQTYNAVGLNWIVWRACGYAEIPTQSDYTEVSGLYYYVGDTVQDASLINAGAVLGQLANVNAASRGYVVESYHNGVEWYRIYSDGWIEQGGRVSIPRDTQTTVTLLKTFSNTNYTVLISACRSGTQTVGDGNFTVEYVSASQFKWSNGDDFDGTGIWYACGY